MQPLLTPGAERAIAAAAKWVRRSPAGKLPPAVAGGEPAPTGPLGLPELLVGLLDEPECRAAKMLAEGRIEMGSILGKWPNLRPLETDELSLPLPAAGRPKCVKRWRPPPPGWPTIRSRWNWPPNICCWGFC